MEIRKKKGGDTFSTQYDWKSQNSFTHLVYHAGADVFIRRRVVASLFVLQQKANTFIWLNRLLADEIILVFAERQLTDAT